MKEILRSFFDDGRKSIPLIELANLVKRNVEEVRSYLNHFFRINRLDEVSISFKYRLGLIDVKERVSFLLQEANDIFVSLKNNAGAMNKDLVLVELIGDQTEGKVIYFVTRALKELIATVQVYRSKKIKFFTDKNYFRAIKVENHQITLVDGHVVKLVVVDVSATTIFCQLFAVIGHKNDPGIEITKIVHAADWPIMFSSAALLDANNAKFDLEEELKIRKDLRNELIITIDGSDAKDLDDAISLHKENGLFRLGVHIADVSYFVKEQTDLGLEAYERATSVYLANKVIPMLPHVISNGVCSLNPGEEKLTISLYMTIDQQGKTVDYELFPSVIKSKHRLTYQAVNQFLNHNQTLEEKSLDQMLLEMNELSEIMKKQRIARGMIEFESTELFFEMNQKDEPTNVSLRKTDVGEELIESFMLLANETIASHLFHLELPALYRIHDTPDLDKLTKALKTISILGIKSDSKKIGKHKHLQQLTNAVRKTKYEYLVNMFLLRSMKKAKYSNQNNGHFGLGARYYTHFTSPIRRYPDLMVHRLLRNLIFEPTNLREKHLKYERELFEIAEHSSSQERTAIQMERDVERLLSCQLMEKKVGQTFSATIIQMMPIGMFVRLDIGIEGLIVVRELKGHYEFNESIMTFLSSHGQDYKLGDVIKVELTAVNMLEKQINFSPVLSKRIQKER